jgi:hypothetical protein
VEKKIHQSLTMQSAVALGILIILKAVLPVYTGYEIPDELFTAVCSLLGISLTYGLRRALPVVLLLIAPLGLVQCGPTICSKATITITDHPTKKSPPAGTVTVKCDGEEKVKIEAGQVNK